MPVVRELSKVGKGQSFFCQTEDYGGVFKDVLFSHPLGEMIQFDKHFWNGLQPSSRIIVCDGKNSIGSCAKHFKRLVAVVSWSFFFEFSTSPKLGEDEAIDKYFSKGFEPSRQVGWFVLTVGRGFDFPPFFEMSTQPSHLYIFGLFGLLFFSKSLNSYWRTTVRQCREERGWVILWVICWVFSTYQMTEIHESTKGPRICW